ncbi:MAG TPA: hypothetical protein PJ988_23045, partial [Anaerolinea sp.]|nr:hypothetical protein [Anaerolinea sp.]
MRSSGATGSSGTPPRQSWIARFLAWIRRPSLRKTVVAAILILSLLPVVLVGAVSFYRTRAQI